MGSVVMNGPYHGRSLSGVEQGATIATTTTTTSTSSSAAAAIAARLSAAKFVLAVSGAWRAGRSRQHPAARPGGTDASGRRLVLSNKLAISDMSTMTMASLRERLIVYARM
ncbi:uncharacterized protein PG998_006348 [Apiospora kogelbergensis]|uniref:uncharacterized protein n=1 Tax=Apiospora kogelbergensis TaxID=1337665 RepID=UPI003131ABCE